MDTPSNNHHYLPTATTPAQEALNALAENTENPLALDTLAGSEVLVPVPYDASEEDVRDPAAVAWPWCWSSRRKQAVPVFTSEPAMAEMLPSVSRYRLVPLGALASQWPTGDLALTIDPSSPNGLTLTSEGVRHPSVRPRA